MILLKYVLDIRRARNGRGIIDVDGQRRVPLRKSGSVSVLMLLWDTAAEQPIQKARLRGISAGRIGSASVIVGRCTSVRKPDVILRNTCFANGAICLFGGVAGVVHCDHTLTCHSRRSI